MKLAALISNQNARRGKNEVTLHDRKDRITKTGQSHVVRVYAVEAVFANHQEKQCYFFILFEKVSYSIAASLIKCRSVIFFLPPEGGRKFFVLLPLDLHSFLPQSGVLNLKSFPPQLPLLQLFSFLL